MLVTGTSLNGIGYETALAIAKHASLVTITGYNADRSVVRFEWVEMAQVPYPQAQADRGGHHEGGAGCKYSAGDSRPF